MDDPTVIKTLCRWLDTAGVGVYRPDGPGFSATDTAIFYGPISPAPDRAVGVTLYATDDDVALGTAIRYVQVRYRGPRNTPDGADALAASGFAALQGVHRRDGITQVRRISTAHLGADDTGRQERTDNFELILSPAPGGTP